MLWLSVVYLIEKRVLTYKFNTDVCISSYTETNIIDRERKDLILSDWI